MISFNEQEKCFHIATEHTSYIIQICDEEQFVGCAYYGSRIPDDNMGYLLRTQEEPYIPSVNNRDRVKFHFAFPFECPGHNVGDDRLSMISVRFPDGDTTIMPLYEKHKIYQGKKKLNGLPATWGSDEDVETLELSLIDPVRPIRVILIYSVFRGIDAIARSMKIENISDEPVEITQAMSACMHLDNEDFDLITLHGEWSCERMIERKPLRCGRNGVDSHRGISSHEEQPFFALAQKGANQTMGDVYAMTLVYSGNFLAQAEMNLRGSIRASIGINPEDFTWHLESGESFETPEAILVYSSQGIGAMSRTFHDLFRDHLVRGKYRQARRPVLVNNWEATYFQFNEEKLLQIAKTAADSGIEMLVMDDGWFGHRDDDNTSLGDWYVYKKKLPEGLGALVEKINALGLKFGIWIEPEMVSVDSDLYRTHPDYALTAPHRVPALRRNQLVLDFSRKEVRDAVYTQISAVLKSANIAYVKWDMNRTLSDVYSASLNAHRMGELYHRYVLGVYDLMERLCQDFPEILLENCASGGGRFDAGMLYYSPQIWTSDNTDAINRLKIQEGTALLYPYSAMGAHVAACPSHSTGRTTPFKTRGRVAMPGCFGYELDLTKLSDEELKQIPKQIEEYRTYGEVFRTGDYYRLASYAENGTHDVIMAVSKDKKIAVINHVQVVSNRQERSVRIRLSGLHPDMYYEDIESAEIRSGSGWMNGGLLLKKAQGDFESFLTVLKAVK